MPASSAIVSRPRYLHANGSEACDETWLRACSEGERTNDGQDQGETARVARLDGDLQFCSAISSRWGTQISLVSGRVHAVWHTDSADSRPVRVDGANRVQTRQALERASSITGAGGVHPDFHTPHPRWTSAHRLPGLGRR